MFIMYNYCILVIMIFIFLLFIIFIIVKFIFIIINVEKFIKNGDIECDKNCLNIKYSFIKCFV